MAILVTGGTGYIGSNTCIELLKAGEDIVVMDNFYNSKPKAVQLIKEISGKDFKFYEADMCNLAEMEKIFAENEIEDVLLHEMIHYYIGVNHIADTSAHGRVFRQMMSDINNRFNRHITISLRSETTKIAESAPRSITFFCIIRMRNGRTGIMPVAKTRIFKIWDMLQTSSDIAEAQWYASRAAFFAKYPKFRTAKIIYVDEKVLSLHLAGAMPLVKTGNVIKPAKNKA